jgi:uncharacterized protein (TIGR03083 family)
MASPGLEQIEADLRAEHDQLDEFVGSLDDLEWDRQTPAAGWAVRDQISHLAFFDDAAALALEDPEAFIPLAQAATDARAPDQRPLDDAR